MTFGGIYRYPATAHVIHAKAKLKKHANIVLFLMDPPWHFPKNPHVFLLMDATEAFLDLFPRQLNTEITFLIFSQHIPLKG